MPITFACSCGKKYTAPDEAAGKQTKCKACGAVVRIPAPRKSSPKPKAAEAPPHPGPLPTTGTIAALYGQPSAPTEKSAAGIGTLIPWAVALAVVVAIGAALKYIVLK